MHDIHRGIRAVLDDYPRGDDRRIWVFDNAEFAKYLRADELHMGFNFRLVRGRSRRPGFTTPSPTAWPQRHWGCQPTWTLSTMTSTVRSPVTAAANAAAGLRAMAMVMLALPGAVFVYNGEELSLPNVGIAGEVLQDPVKERSGAHRTRTRRLPVPMPWEGRSSIVRLLHQPGHLAAGSHLNGPG